MTISQILAICDARPAKTSADLISEATNSTNTSELATAIISDANFIAGLNNYISSNVPSVYNDDLI